MSRVDTYLCKIQVKRLNTLFTDYSSKLSIWNYYTGCIIIFKFHVINQNNTIIKLKAKSQKTIEYFYPTPLLLESSVYKKDKYTRQTNQSINKINSSLRAAGRGWAGLIAGLESILTFVRKQQNAPRFVASVLYTYVRCDPAHYVGTRYMKVHVIFNVVLDEFKTKAELGPI